MEKKFKPNSVEKAMTFYFSLGEEAGEKWGLEIGPSSCKFTEGKPAKDADVFLKTSAQMFLDMISGKYTPGMRDFMTGRVKSNDPLKLKVLTKAFGG
ncbi:SCP2 sterol-binding domain-containing protein [bacterium]|nr:SCP2 sterol-binding domain-containing protein [bacterium]